MLRSQVNTGILMANVMLLLGRNSGIFQSSLQPFEEMFNPGIDAMRKNCSSFTKAMHFEFYQKV